MVVGLAAFILKVVKLKKDQEQYEERIKKKRNGPPSLEKNDV